MNRDEIILIIETILNDELEMKIKNIETNKTLIELGIDSITLMTLIVYIEEKLTIEINITEGLNDEYSKITLDTLINSIDKMRK